MRPSYRALASLICSLAYACGDDGGSLSAGADELATDEDTSRGTPSAGVSQGLPPTRGEGSSEPPFVCPQGGKVGALRVDFACGEITVFSCKDLSNVVLEFADGTRERFEGLHGQRGYFSGTGAHAGAAITHVWVKAGANHSGEGPGYGERFDAPLDSCERPPEGCLVADGSCTPRPPPGDDCFVADGSCTPSPPSPPPSDEDCFVADGTCKPRPPSPPPASDDPELVI